MENTEVEVTTEGTYKVSVTFERKLGYDDYGNAVARAWVEGEVPAGASQQDIAAKINDMMTPVKVAIYDELGIEMFADTSEDGVTVIREKHSPTVSVKQAADKVGTGFPGTTEEKYGGLKVRNEENLENGQVPDYIVQKCAEKGITAVWANKGKFGTFFKEVVPQGGSPKIEDPNNPGKAGIIKSDS